MKHLFFYSCVCFLIKLDEPTIYDIDKITDEMNKFDDYSLDQIKQLKLNNNEYSRDDVREFWRLVEIFRDREPRMSMVECIKQLFYMVSTNPLKQIYEILFFE